jgi:nickel-dependent lactate racemase
MKLCLPELFWYGGSTLDLDLPDARDVELCPMRGAQRPELDDRELAHAIRNPIASPPIRELARSKRKAVVVFDDMTRPTPVHRIAPVVVEELVAGGIDEEQISFVCALGTHGALSQIELGKKVGLEILERFRVYNHNCYENCTVIGTTSRGTRLAVNREVMSADLKVAIGCVTAHANTGFSGGGKIILPGVSHIDSIAHYHLEVPKEAPESVGLGNFDRNVMRFDIEEAARLAGLDFKIDVVVNERGETSGVFAGDFIEAHEKAVAEAKVLYALHPKPSGKDIVIANAFIKPNEMAIAVLVGVLGLEGLRGTVVIIANAPEGQVVHYLLGRFGENYGGRQYPVAAIPTSLNLVIQAPHRAKTFADWFGNPEAVVWTRDWGETRTELERRHRSRARVAVVPSATMAYYGG